MIHLDHRDRRPIYEQTLEGIRQQIRAGVLLPGEQLPSVRELSAALSVNPNTIQRSYRELERTGWIVTLAGKGSFVAPRPESADGTEWTEFDSAVRSLLESGHTAGELHARLDYIGGENHA
jgi:GntR family transcriptional regulator